MLLPAGSRPRPRPQAVRERLAAPVDGASLAVFRIAFGLVLVWEAYRYFSHGWIPRYWIEPAFNFGYPGYGWLEPLPGAGMYVVWALIGVAGLGIALGTWYRVSATVAFVLFGYQFLLEQARYLNHFYLMILLLGILVVVPAHRTWSLDAGASPRPGDGTVRTWTLWLVRFQIAAMYVGGGIAKLNWDWLSGTPLDRWLAQHTSWPVIGPFLDDPGVAVGAAWAAMLLDLLIVPAVLWRRTRYPALVVILAFHVLNARLFQIGVFPVLATAATLVLLGPSWPRALAARVRGLARGARESRGDARVPAPGLASRRLSGLALAALGLFVAVQVLLPLRHFAYGGDVSWDERGHNFSWHMKLRTKSGDAVFTVVDPASGTRRTIFPGDELEGWQADSLAVRPHLILQYGLHLAAEARAQGIAAPQVYASSAVSLNGRDRAAMLDPTVDLVTAASAVDFVLPAPPRGSR